MYTFSKLAYVICQYEIMHLKFDKLIECFCLLSVDKNLRLKMTALADVPSVYNS